MVDKASLTVTAATPNTDVYRLGEPDEVIGRKLKELLPEKTLAAILSVCDRLEPSVVSLPDESGRALQVVVHGSPSELVLEVEDGRDWPNPDDYATRLNNFTRELEDAPTTDELLENLCAGIVYHLGYDRAMVLKLDPDFKGRITHESRADGLPPFLGNYYSEEDITATLRYNQRVNTVHNVADTAEPLVEVRGTFGPAANDLLCHRVAARMPNDNFVDFAEDNALRCIGYLSLMVDGQLYGALYLHSRQPLFLDYQMRTFLTVVGRVAQQKLSFLLYSRSLRLQRAANVTRDRLQDRIVTSDNLTEGLTGGSTTLIDLLEHTHGAALCSDNVLTLHGITPDTDQINGIVEWMRNHHGDEELYHTDHLGELHPPARNFPQLTAGILFLPLDVEANQWIVWFRPEAVQKITYGSSASRVEGERGRRQYRVYDSTRYGHSLPWSNDDVGTALALQSFIQDVVMQRYAQANRNNRLLREAYDDLEAFSYTIGHDLRAPLRGIASFAEILEEDFAPVLGEEGRGYLDHIRQNALRMRTFMNNLLELSKIDRKSMIVNELSVNELVRRVLDDLATGEDCEYNCVVGDDLPPICGDGNHLVTVFTNLLSNAIKYSEQVAEPRIEVGFTGNSFEGHPIFYVSDNGIGIPAEERDRVFDIFARSSNADGFQGNGIGLALVQRIIKFHEGRIWLDESVTEGARFLFYSGVSA